MQWALIQRIVDIAERILTLGFTLCMRILNTSALLKSKK
jgi:hypothetical protein